MIKIEDNINYYKGLIKFCDELLTTEPKNELIWVLKGIAFFGLDYFSKSEECFEEAIKINPKNTIALCLIAVVESIMGLDEEALEYVDKALEINPEDAAALELKSDILTRLERYEEALEYVDKALEINPEDATALELKSDILHFLKRYSESEVYSSKAKKFFDNFGEIYFRKPIYFPSYYLKKLVKKFSIKSNINIEVRGKFVKDEWRKGEIIIKNDGKIKAEDITLDFISDVVKVDGKRKIGSIDEGKTKKLEVRIKSEDAGYVPLGIKVSYRNPITGKEESKLIYPDIYVGKEEDAFSNAILKSHPHRINSRIKSLYKETEEISFNYGDFFSYKIIDRIGSGGFSNVFLVEANGQKYAMKIPKGIDMSGEETVELSKNDVKKYGEEANIWAMLTEKLPNVVINLIDAGITPFPWFVMELADYSLREKMKDMSNEEKMKLIIDLLNKIDKIHHLGVVHRDLKPENILFINEKAKLTDFGLSKIVIKSSRTAFSSGTPYYMAPEQISKKKFGGIDWRTDIWQIGVMAYEILTGEIPFKGEGYDEIGMSIIFDDPLPLTEHGYDDKLNDIIMKALNKNKDERYQSAIEFRNELRRHMGKRKTINNNF